MPGIQYSGHRARAGKKEGGVLWMDSEGDSENHAQDEKHGQSIERQTLLLDDSAAHEATPSKR